jgi:hypothetical protein
VPLVFQRVPVSWPQVLVLDRLRRMHCQVQLMPALARVFPVPVMHWYRRPRWPPLVRSQAYQR